MNNIVLGGGRRRKQSVLNWTFSQVAAHDRFPSLSLDVTAQYASTPSRKGWRLRDGWADKVFDRHRSPRRATQTAWGCVPWPAGPVVQYCLCFLIDADCIFLTSISHNVMAPLQRAKEFLPQKPTNAVWGSGPGAALCRRPMCSGPYNCGTQTYLYLPVSISSP